MTPRFFKVEEAIRTLPLVQRIVADLVADYGAWRAKVSRFEWLAGTSASESEELGTMRGEIELLAARIDGYREELAAIGCVSKDYETGLVDFYGRFDGRDVFWCWKLGETTIEHWHELDAGFAGRQPLPASVMGATE